jgi:hypothetical protein
VTLKEFAKNINELVAKHGEKEVWYATDDEGNGYSPVYYTPTLSNTRDLGGDLRGMESKEVILIN